jgi:hypothetical protein
LIVSTTGIWRKPPKRLSNGSMTYINTDIISRYVTKTNTFSSGYFERLSAPRGLFCGNGKQLHWRRISSAQGTISLRFSARLALDGCVEINSGISVLLSVVLTVCQKLTDSRTS